MLLFCDPGIDDAIAVMYVLMNPNLELVGIVTSYGNVTQKQATTNASYILHVAGMSHIPVIPAACVSIAEKNEGVYPEVHGASGLGFLTPQGHFLGNIQSFDMIRSIALHYQQQLFIVETGRMTSLALALNVFQQELSYIGGVYIMGGAFFMPGNRTPVAEANVYGDSIAAKFVLHHTEAVLTPLNATEQAILPPSLVAKLIKHPLFGFLLEQLLPHYESYYFKKDPQAIGAPIHDLVPVILLENPEIATYIKRDVTVVTQGEAKGMTYIDLRASSKAGKHHIAWTIDQARFAEKVERVFFTSYTN